MLSFITRIIENKFAKTSLVLVLLQGLTLVVSFLGNILLAGIYEDPSGFGEFNYYFSIITTIGYSATFGLDTYLLKKNTEFSLRNDKKGIVELLQKSLTITLFFSITTSFILFAVLSQFFTKILFIHIYLCGGIVFTGLLVVRSFSLRSLGELMYSNILNQSGKTLIFYSFVLLVYATTTIVHANIGVVSFVFATILCWLLIEVLLNHWKIKEQHSNSFSYKFLLKAGLPFFAYDLIGNLAVNMDIFIIEKMSDHLFLGHYLFYKKLSYVPFMVIVVVGTVLQTKYLELYENKDHLKLQILVFKTNRMILVFAVLACVFLVVAFHMFSNYIGLFKDFFAQYLGFEHYLYILCCCEIICAAFGPSNYFMLMLGFEKLSVLVDVFYCMSLILIGWLFFIFLGNEGFLWAYVICKIVKNLVCWYIIKKRTDISFLII